MATSRRDQIDQVLIDLRALRDSTEQRRNLDAIEENIFFFEACRSLGSYTSWLLGRARTLDPERMREINDLLPKYDETMHRKLIEMEQRPFPGLIEPLVERLTEIIQKSDRDLVIADFGSGGMEAERQVIERLLASGFKRNILFIGIDQSDNARSVAHSNLASLGDRINRVDIEELTETNLEELRASQKGICVVFTKNDLFELDRLLPGRAFDICFHTLFKHHLNSGERETIDRVLKTVSKIVIEYDGYKSFPAFIPQTIVGWGNPVFLNAEVFSNLRFLPKSMLKKLYTDKKIIFTSAGYYMLEYQG